MLRSFMLAVSCAALTCLASASGSASELTYRPVNPSFGGNSYNSTHLLGIAGAINKYKDPAIEAEKRLREQERASGIEFGRIIQNSLLSRISSQIASQIYGEGAAPSGTFLVGNTQVDFVRDGENTKVTIIDVATGGQTNIIIPTPGF